MAVCQSSDYLKDQKHSLEGHSDHRHIKSFLGHNLPTRSDATGQQRYRSLTVLFRWPLAKGEIATDPMERIAKPKVEENPIQIITERQFNAVLETSDFDFLGRRDEAIMRLLSNWGMRASELCDISTET